MGTYQSARRFENVKHEKHVIVNMKIVLGQDEKQIESQQEHYGTTENVEWEVDDYHLQRLKELGLEIKKK